MSRVYQNALNVIKKTKKDYPNVAIFLEDNEPIEFSNNELYAILDILDKQGIINDIQLKETFKLGGKEMLIYLYNMGMLKI